MANHLAAIRKLSAQEFASLGSLALDKLRHTWLIAALLLKPYVEVRPCDPLRHKENPAMPAPIKTTVLLKGFFVEIRLNMGNWSLWDAGQDP